MAISAKPALTAAAPRVGSMAPRFSAALALDSKHSFDLGRLKGRGVYLNFFASWCGPCKVEAPSISRLSLAFSKRQVVVVGVDELEDASQVQRFAQHYKLTYPLALDRNGEVGAAYGLIGLPLHVFITPSGRVAAWRTGELSETEMTGLLKRIAAK